MQGNRRIGGLLCPQRKDELFMSVFRKIMEGFVMNKTTIGLMIFMVLLLLAIPAEFLIYINFFC